MGEKKGITDWVETLTYGRLLLKAQEEIKRGRSVILDATFSSRHWRREAARLAEDTDANFRVVECIAPEKILRILSASFTLQS